MTGRTVHRSGTLVLSVLMAAIGLALIGQVIGGDGGVISARLLLGVLFLAGGLARLWLERKRGRTHE
ncbi:MAG TPA: hypothetical protein VK774_02355 [Solirubrobacteraceae bacterium]|jgi:hypothetical protein|nr:hypothetical protein [Solirubrobacteraceae bacterium]